MPGARAPGRGPPTPALLAHDDDARILVLSDEPGAPADLGPRAPAVHRQLGVILRRLHGLPRDDRDPLPLREAARRRLAAGLARAESALRPAERAAIERRFAGADALADARRVPCHRDVGPHNLLVSTGQGGAAPRVILIDFEHARLDVWAADLVKLACGPWRARPELAEAFAAGYGRAPLRESSTRALASKEAYAAALDPALVCCVLLHAVATIAWGRAHAEPELLAQGRAALAVAGV
ncbi:MAG: aminoglycoside phosphotransferase family protein [Myxococcales bacterium]|nr:aminoglycoside phosphotransferase family protein [Myxococcales bacterium]